MFYHKAAVMGALVLKPRLLGLYAPLRIPFKRERAAIGKTLELPEAKYLCIKMGKLKKRGFSISNIYVIVNDR